MKKVCLQAGDNYYFGAAESVKVACIRAATEANAQNSGGPVSRGNSTWYVCTEQMIRLRNTHGDPLEEYETYELFDPWADEEKHLRPMITPYHYRHD